ncbi:hypothetical protein [Emticicia sp. C21]|uniref:hypothetical protein n=1 Tax=Emticicia sp. C21 TaxID=2302915 RepID=UPI000E86A9D0|nr:hypothetical protein [Emticicia sp. C21]RFS13825.1 hypothetical protein D0T08_24130 [Emticicia sp. C21]
MKNSFIFWQRWLFYSSLLLAILAMLFAFNVNLPLFPHYDQAISRIFWHLNEIPTDVKEFRQFVAGPLGGTIACCYVLLAYIVWYPFQKKETWARNAIVVAFTIWCLIDSYICFKFQVYFQIYLINALSVLQKALPIIFTWNAFKN